MDILVYIFLYLLIGGAIAILWFNYSEEIYEFFWHIFKLKSKSSIVRDFFVLFSAGPLFWLSIVVSKLVRIILSPFRKVEKE